MSLLSKQDVSVRQDNDIIVLTIGTTAIPMSYSTALNISQALRVGGNHALAVEGVNRLERLALGKKSLTDVDVPSVVRDSDFIVNMTGRPWEIRVHGALVGLSLNGHTIKMEGDPALTISGWLKIEAKKAKRWAGDTGKSFRAFGILGDAEENYRLGIS